MFSRRNFAGLLGGAVLGTWAVSGRAGARVARVPDCRLVLPGARQYAAASLDFNARFSYAPGAIAFCGSVTGVQSALELAAELGRGLRVRSGGHSYEAYSLLDHGVVLDVSPMNAVRVDRAKGEAVIGAGAKLGEVYDALWRAGVRIPAGTCPTVGLTGLTLGGGIGFLTRDEGLTCDALTGAEIVLADGSVVEASEAEHPDLFWALRGGGGGNFGVVTALRFRVREAKDVSVFTVTWPWSEVAAVIDAWQDWAPAVDARLTASLGVRAGQVGCTGQFTGPEAELKPLLQKLLTSVTGYELKWQRLSYGEAVALLADPVVPHRKFKNSGGYVETRLSAAAIGRLVGALEEDPDADRVVGFLACGGAVSRLAPDATAYVARDARFLMQYQAYWEDDAQAEAGLRWTEALRRSLLPETTGTYVNFVDSDIGDWMTAYYGGNAARLAAVKAKYDPEGVFRFPQAIQRAP